MDKVDEGRCFSGADAAPRPGLNPRASPNLGRASLVAADVFSFMRPSSIATLLTEENERGILQASREVREAGRNSKARGNLARPSFPNQAEGERCPPSGRA